jgi:hypothetical protein
MKTFKCDNHPSTKRNTILQNQVLTSSLPDTTQTHSLFKDIHSINEITQTPPSIKKTMNKKNLTELQFPAKHLYTNLNVPLNKKKLTVHRTPITWSKKLDEHSNQQGYYTVHTDENINSENKPKCKNDSTCGNSINNNNNSSTVPAQKQSLALKNSIHHHKSKTSPQYESSISSFIEASTALNAGNSSLYKHKKRDFSLTVKTNNFNPLKLRQQIQELDGSSSTNTKSQSKHNNNNNNNISKHGLFIGLSNNNNNSNSSNHINKATISKNKKTSNSIISKTTPSGCRNNNISNCSNCGNNNNNSIYNNSIYNGISNNNKHIHAMYHNYNSNNNYESNNHNHINKSNISLTNNDIFDYADEKQIELNTSEKAIYGDRHPKNYTKVKLLGK